MQFGIRETSRWKPFPIERDGKPVIAEQLVDQPWWNWLNSFGHGHRPKRESGSQHKAKQGVDHLPQPAGIYDDRGCQPGSSSGR